MRQVASVFDAAARWRLGWLLLSVAAVAALEAISAGLVVPLVAMIADPGYIAAQPTLRALYGWSGATSPSGFIALCAVALLALFAFKNAVAFLTLRYQYRLLYGEMSRVVEKLLGIYLRREYAFHAGTNSSVLVRNVTNEVLMLFTNVIMPAMVVASELLVVAAVVALLVWLSPASALLSVLALGATMAAFFALVRRRVRVLGATQQREVAERLKWAGHALGGVKEIKIYGAEDYFVSRFAEHERRFSGATEFAMLLNQTPRLFVETLAFGALFVTVAVAATFGSDPTGALPLLALFAMAAVRLLPSVNRIVLSVTRIAYYRPSVDVVCADLIAQPASAESPCGGPAPLGTFRSELEFRDVTFRYPGSSRAAVQRVSFRVTPGDSIALLGPSGAGKSTIGDLVLGLLSPTSGAILVDGIPLAHLGHHWQRQVGYIPQVVYLIDDTIRRNVAFGIPDEAIDDERIWRALEIVRLAQFVRDLPGVLEFGVGERGTRLSGGQRQRIAIARALYRDPQVLVLDEATSALDDAAEQAIAEAIESLRGTKTLFVIAHRPATVERCNVRLRMNDGELQWTA